MTEDDLKRAVRLWAASACWYDDADDFGDGTPESWAVLLEAIASYVLVTGGGGAFIQLGDLELLLAKAAVCDAIRDLHPEYLADHGGNNREPECSLCCAVEALRELEAKP